MIEIARSAYAAVEAGTTEQAYDKVVALLDEGEIRGWGKDVPQVTIEALPEEDV